MMKLTLCTLLATLSFGAFAQNLDSTIERQIERLGRAQQRGAISQLSSGEKEELSNLLQGALRTVRDNDGRDGRHGARDGHMIVALIGNHLALIRGRSPGDLLLSCTQAVQVLPITAGRFYVKDIVFTVNGGRYIRRHNANSIWVTSDEICLQMVNERGNPNENAAYIKVSGTIESRPVSLEGSRGQILESCAETSRNRSYVADIVLSINGGQLTTATRTSSYWSGAAQICGKIGAMIDEQVR